MIPILNGNLLAWPPRSPDLNPTENVWDIMEKRLSRLPHPLNTLDELRPQCLEGLLVFL